jgi:hypothetical protein
MIKVNWSKPPKFIVVGGSEWFAIDRFRSKITESAVSSGFEVVVADTVPDLFEACAPDPWSFSSGGPTKKFVVFRSWRCEDLQGLKEEFAPDRGVCVLYVIEGAISKKVCPVLPKVPEDLVLKFNKFSGSWSKTLENAVEFVSKEFKHFGMTPPSDSLLESMVKTAGFDIGTLHFEVEKAVRFARSLGRDSVNVEIIRDTIKPTNHFDMTPMRESLSLLKPDRFLKFTHTAYSRSVSDPTMVLLRGKGGMVDLSTSWLMTSMLLDSGSESPEKISKITGVPDWAVTKDLIPSARRWGTDRLKALVSGLADAEVGFFSGCPNPRVKLESSVVQAMKSGQLR